MLKLTILTIIFMFVLFSLPAFATISYTTCQVNDCVLSIGECESGMLNIYSTSTCSGLPNYQYAFSNSRYSWSPIQTGTYYMRAFCDDGTKTSCTSINVRISTPTTRFTNTSRQACPNECCVDEPNYFNKPCKADEACIDGVCISTAEKKDNSGLIIAMIVIAVIFIIVIVVLFVLPMFKKKSPKNYDELYRKWGR